jgi:CopA family copper-resistance protein
MKHYSPFKTPSLWHENSFIIIDQFFNMKKIIFLLLLSNTFTFAQHEGHQMPDKKQNTQNKKSNLQPAKKIEKGLNSTKNTLPLSRIVAQDLIKPTGKTIEYDLNIDYKEVNYTGKKATAIAINNGTAGTVLQFTEGDSAVIHIHNKLKAETSIHWHGILVPNRQDGVSYLNTPPILAGETYTFRFPILQSGTYWYHAHNIQEQIGLHGAIVIQRKLPTIKVDKEVVLLISDWADEGAGSIIKNLKRRNEWYSIRKNNIQSLDRIIKNKAVGAYLKQSFQRMPPMDISDIAYDKFFINGLTTSSLEDLKPNERIRVRVINAGTSSYFNVNFAGGDMEMVANDGQDIQPVQVNHQLMGMGETFDFILTIPNDKAYEIRATAQDGSGFASFFLGKGMKMEAPAIPKPNLYEMTRTMSSMKMSAMKKKGNHVKTFPTYTSSENDKSIPQKQHDMKGMDMKHDMKDHDMKGHDMNNMDMDLGDYNTSNYHNLKATEPIVFPENRPLREIRLELSGDMRRYIWGFDGKPMSREENINIKRGEIVRFNMVNTTMMFHPIHLHGHYFRVLNGQGEYSPLKHTVSLAPMESITIEFLADDEKDWIFHCHLLYHMALGMARVIKYEGDTPDADIATMHHKFMASMNDNAYFFWGNIDIGVTNSYLRMNRSNNRNAFIFSGDANWKGDYEIDLDYERYLTQYFRVFGGVDAGNELFLRKSKSDKSSTIDSKIIRPVIGIRYLLPFLIDSEVKIDSKGNVRLQLLGQQRLTRRLGLEYEGQWLIDGYTRLHAGLDYVLTRNVSLFANYDTRYKTAGGGLSFKF